MKKRGPRRDYTEEDVIQIKKQNRERLEGILSDPNWRRTVGIKHYGEKNWQKMMFGEKHPDYLEWKWDETRNKTPLTELPLQEWTLDDQLIDEYKNVNEVIEKYGWGDSNKQHIMACLRGKRVTAYNKKWTLKKEL